ncbi:MAG: hypothetical protein N2C14_17475, partial [Planctomycetales bacterium]
MKRPSLPCVRLFLALSAIALARLGSPCVVAADSTLTRISVDPPRVSLLGKRDRVQLVVTGFYADGRTRDLTGEAKYAIDAEQVVRMSNAAVEPIQDGAAEITVVAGGQSQQVQVRVSGVGPRDPVSFRREVLPTLWKNGCSAGTCHGSPNGKGGFRLSLRAFDPTLDAFTLTREEFGRRTNPLDPDESLMLIKPMMYVAHAGGLQLRRTDRA